MGGNVLYEFLPGECWRYAYRSVLDSVASFITSLPLSPFMYTDILILNFVTDENEKAHREIARQEKHLRMFNIN